MKQLCSFALQDRRNEHPARGGCGACLHLLGALLLGRPLVAGRCACSKIKSVYIDDWVSKIVRPIVRSGTCIVVCTSHFNTYQC